MAHFEEAETRLVELSIRACANDDRVFTVSCEFEDGILYDNKTGPGTVKSFFLQYSRGNEGQCWADAHGCIMYTRTDRIINIDDVLRDPTNVKCVYDTTMEHCRGEEHIIEALHEADPDGLFNRTRVVGLLSTFENYENLVHPYIASSEYLEGVLDAWRQIFESMYDLPYAREILIDDSDVDFDSIPYEEGFEDDTDESIGDDAYGNEPLWTQ